MGISCDVLKVKRFVVEYFPGTKAFMISGSFNTQYFNEYSDYDIVLFSNWHRDVYVESYDFEDAKMQVIVLPLSDLESVLYKEIAEGRGAIIAMLSKGVIVRDSNDFLLKLQTRCLNIYKQGPDIARLKTLDSLRARITTCLEDLEGSKNFNEQVFTLLEAYPNLLRLQQLYNRRWLYTGKSASRELKFLDNNFHHNFVSSLSDFFRTQDKYYLLGFVKSELEKYGGELHFTSTRKFRDKCIENYCIVYIRPCSNDFDFMKAYGIGVQLAEFLMKHLVGLNISVLKYPTSQIYDPGVYVLISGSISCLNDLVLPKIQLFHYGSVFSTLSGMVNNWQYPYNTSPFDIYSDAHERNVVFALFNKVFLYKNAYKELVRKDDLNIELGIMLLLEIKDIRLLEGANTSLWAYIYSLYKKTSLDKIPHPVNEGYLLDLVESRLNTQMDNLVVEDIEPLSEGLRKAILDVKLYYLSISLAEGLDESNYEFKELLFNKYFMVIDTLLDILCIDDKLLVIHYTLNRK